MLRPMKTAIVNLQPEFATVSRSRPLATVHERDRMAGGLWTSITTAGQANHQTSPAVENSLGDDSGIQTRILKSLEFEDMTARESQIDNPFPETFQWLLDDQRPGTGGTSAAGAPTPTKFKEWLESQANETPFWITGHPASGKSTMMKFISTNPQIRPCLQAWSGEHKLLTCSVYFWNPGSLGQKSQVGLLSTVLHQLLRQRPDLCHSVASRRCLYFQLAGTDSPDPQNWTLEELQICLTSFVSQIEGTDRLALFVDGLDEYEGNLDNLISFLKRLHHDHKVKLCISSRPWNAFKDAFRTYPSLKMELFTKPDIAKYVCTRIGGSPAFQELRKPFSASVEKLESQIVDKADGVFLWVALVVEKVVATAQENNDLTEIWNVFNSLPPGLEELYASMRRRLDPAHRERASMMYQLLFRWNEILGRSFYASEFWMAVNCHDTTEPQPCPEDDATVLPLLERRLAGATGGILRIHVALPDGHLRKPSPTARVGFLHRTVSDWLQSIRSSIEKDGPAHYDSGLVLTSVLVSRWSPRGKEEAWALLKGMLEIFNAGQSCNHSPEARSQLLRIIDRLQVADRRRSGVDAEEDIFIGSASDSTIRSYLAVRFACPQYLQAKLESSSRATGLELPRKLRMVPAMFWSVSQGGFLNLILRKLFEHADLSSELSPEPDTLQILNRMLKTFEILLQAQVAPRRTLRSWAKFNERFNIYRLPQEFWSSFWAGFEGKGFVEITSIESHAL